ncbi:T9SS type A sorting domain-containing protein [Hymenobacter oligotrophus]|nr:T9SS type A sorting domain-containing protein [Hymenobacter oligotrophus]
MATGSATVTSSTSGLQFSLDGEDYAAYPNGGYSGLAPGSYTLTARNAAGCVSAVANFTINPQPATPAAPTVNATQPTCEQGSGSIAVTSSTAGLQFSLNNGDFASYPSGGYTNLAPGNYTLRARNGAGCISEAAAVTINPAPSTPDAPEVSIVQPTCTTATGSFTVTSSTSGLQFSLNNGEFANYPSGGYANLAPGTYSLRARNTAGCISAAATVVINQQPATPGAPTVSAVQPTCAVATGSATITSNTSGLQFSLNGGSFAAYPMGGYSNLAPGSYSLVAKNGAGCTSAAANFTINPQPGTPGAPTVEVTQPTCAVGTGTIAVTAPVGQGFEYNLNGGTWQSSSTFSNVAPGTYQVRVRNDDGCVSAAATATVSPQPAAPAAPKLSTTQPSCTVATGSITVTEPTGMGLQYNLNNGTWQSGTTFGNLAPGTYQVRVKNADNCVSGPTSAIINQQPSTPAPPTYSATQPTCTTSTGSITVTAPTGTGLEYNLNGGTWQSGTMFSNLAPGTYLLRVRNGANCVSAASSVTIDPAPSSPGAPTVRSSEVCSAPGGTVALSGFVTPTAGATIVFTTAAGVALSPQPSTQSIAAVGAFTFYVRQQIGSCISPVVSFTITVKTCNEGCTLGYWKNHTNRWCLAYSPNTKYGSVFGDKQAGSDVVVNGKVVDDGIPKDIENLTLLQALNLGGGGVYNLARQSVAALLNACSDEVTYALTTSSVISNVNTAFKSGGAAPGKMATTLDNLNNAGCPLGGTPATTSAALGAQAAPSSAALRGGGELEPSVFPNPTGEDATITFAAAKSGRAVVEVYNVLGAKVATLFDAQVQAGEVKEVMFRGASLPTGTYIYRISTNGQSKTNRISLVK